MKPDQQAIEALGEEIERRRLKRAAIAARLNWSETKLSRILTGERRARLADFLALCAVIGTPAAHILASLPSTMT